MPITALPHRLDALHRLQGLRGRVQGMERASPTTGSRSPGFSYDNTGGPRPLDLAAREVHRARRGAAGAGRRRLSQQRVPLGLLVRRLQALRERRLPRGVSDRIDRPHRVRRRLHPARHLQRLRLLRRRLPVRRRRSAARTTGGRSSARSATTGRRPGCSRRARRPARRSRFSSASSTSCASARRAASRAARARHRRRAWSTTRATAASAARTRSSSSAANRRSTICPRRPRCRPST